MTAINISATVGEINGDLLNFHFDAQVSFDASAIAPNFNQTRSESEAGTESTIEFEVLEHQADFSAIFSKTGFSGEAVGSRFVVVRLTSNSSPPFEELLPPTLASNQDHFDIEGTLEPGKYKLLVGCIVGAEIRVKNGSTDANDAGSCIFDFSLN